MFTKSVKKKAKDWHDGYLKWHTFNYRAILYDDQRKPVANEFFPNRTISSNSDLDFSNAIVQIGDQIETLQANLEHIYQARSIGNDRSIAPSDMAEERRQSNTPAVRQPETPRVPISLQKRIYPRSSSQSSSLRSLHSRSPSTMHNGSVVKSLQTPIRRQGLSKSATSTKCTERGSSIRPPKRIYPLVRSQLNPVDFQNEAFHAGWFSREDRSTTFDSPQGHGNSEGTKPETSHDQERAKSKLITKKQASESCNFRDKPSSKHEKSAIVQPELSPSSIHGTLVPANEPLVHNFRTEDLPSEKQSKSRLDPTRNTTSRKPRQLLAATKYRRDSSIFRKTSHSYAKDSTNMIDPFSESSPDLGSSSPRARNLDVQKSAELVQEAVFDVDSARWVEDAGAELRADISTQIARRNVTSTLVLGRPSNEPQPKASAHCRSPTRHTCDNITGTHQHGTEVLQEVQQVAMAEAGIRLTPEYRSSPQLDDFGFLQKLPCRKSSAASRKSGQSHRRNLKQPRAIHHLVERFPSSFSQPEPEAMLEELFEQGSSPTNTTVKHSPLFLPDWTQESINISDVDVEVPSISTQIAVRAARAIAKSSSIGKLANNNKKQRPSYRPLLKSLATRQPTMIEARTTDVTSLPGQSTVHETFIKQQTITKIDSVCDRSGKESGCNNNLDSLPGTPVELATAELDTFFGNHSIDSNRTHPKASLPKESNLCTTLSRETSGSFAEADTSRRSRKRTISKDDHDGDQTLKLATQMNQRAPDFMSAKSFNSGAILQIDQPIEAVGMSARELATLDLPSQLSQM